MPKKSMTGGHRQGSGIDPNLLSLARRATELSAKSADDPQVGGEALQLLDELSGRALEQDLTHYSEDRQLLVARTAKLGRSLLLEIGGLRGAAERGESLRILSTFCRFYFALLSSDEDNIDAWTSDILELSAAVRRFRLRHHLTLAEPIWATGAVPARPNAVWYTGPDQWRDAADQACAELGLHIRDATPNEYAQSCWDAIRSSAVILCGLGGDSANISDACYQIGIALSVGAPLVVLAKKGETVPFDVGVEAVEIEDRPDAVGNIRHAIERALFDIGFVSEKRRSTETFKYAVLRSRRWLEADHLQRFVRRLLDDKTNIEDPLQVERSIRTLWAGISDAPVFIRPAWPGRYPSEDERRCFHIMPFGETWSDSVRSAVERACRGAGVTYDRGDIGESEPRVLHEIWDKIGAATHLVVDVTGNNPNVAAELGMAHTLGQRRQLVLRQSRDSGELPGALRRIRFVEYNADDDDDISGIMAGFLA